MKVTKSYIKQLVKEELNRVLNENITFEEFNFPMFKSFFEDSPNSFEKLIYQMSDEYLKHHSQYNSFSEADILTIRRKFMPVYREAIKSSWSAYPNNRKEPQEQEVKNYRDNGELLSYGPGNAVSKQFKKALQSAQTADRTEWNRMDAERYLNSIVRHRIGN